MALILFRVKYKDLTMTHKALPGLALPLLTSSTSPLTHSTPVTSVSLLGVSQTL